MSKAKRSPKGASFLAIALLLADVAVSGCDSMRPVAQRFEVTVSSVANGAPVNGAVVTAAGWEYSDATRPTEEQLSSQLGTMAQARKNTGITDQEGRATILVTAVAMGTAVHPPEFSRSGFVGRRMIFRIETGGAPEYLTEPAIQPGAKAAGHRFMISIDNIEPMRRQE
jgi:hypothetical protein